MHDDTNEWRFSTHKNGSETVITRGRLYRVPDDWDSWSSYWDGSETVGFYEEYTRGQRILDTGDREDSERALASYLAAKAYESDPHAALDRLAVRLSGNHEARFITVGLDRGCDLFVLSWSGDPDNAWRDEIEAVSRGDVWRVETEEMTDDEETVWYEFGAVTYPRSWAPADDMCEEWYGEDNARAGFEREFPLPEFPAELTVSEVGA